MSTYTQLLYQIVFATKYRKSVLTKDKRILLFTYMKSVLENKKCYVYIINGVEDHIHIVTSINPSVSISNMVKDLKVASSRFINENNIFPGFEGWQKGYAAFTYSLDSKDRLFQYVKNQEEHHKLKNSKDELKSLLKRHSVDYNEKYFE